MKEKFYITTAIAYTSRKPHIGNTYEIVLTDAIARFKRLIGFDVFFLTGTDEHGQKIQTCAEEAGIKPKEYVDKVAGEVKAIWDLMNSSYDKFIRTTDGYHEKAVQKIFKKLYDQGDIYKGSYEGHYCTPCESFFTKTQLVDGKCPDCGREVTLTSEEAYFFKMSKYADKLIKYIEDNPDMIVPESRKKEMINNFLNAGLQDLCVSRTSFSWGVPVTFDEKHVIYVWIDALSNYITALGYDPDGSSELFNKYWPCDLHVIGKDILRFHTIYWPIMLMALDIPLPKKIFGHPWLLSGNDKMSKSKGNVMYADELVARFGVDPIRFYLLSEMPYAQDGTISYENIITRFNSELANTLGNLVNRTVSMVNKYFGGVIPTPGEDDEFAKDLKETALKTVASVKEKMDEYKVSDAVDEIFTLLRRSNKYIDETAPWVLAKNEEDKDKLASCMYNLLETIRISAVLLSSFMPETSEAIMKQINSSLSDWASVQSFGGIKAGDSVGTPVPLFARLDEKKLLEEIEAELAAKAEEKEPEITFKDEIEFSDFEKLDLRLAYVKDCKKVEKADKLLNFTLDVGGKERTILSGIAKYYKPEDLIGKKVIIIANLKPRMLRGIKSEGMILSVATDDELELLVHNGNLPSGSEVC